MFPRCALNCERHAAKTGYFPSLRISTYRILSTQIAELSFIPLVARDQSPLPCLSNHMLSSRILCGSKLSRTSSGNHCRSDPVQVQSTARIATILEPICDGGRTCVSEVVHNAERNYCCDDMKHAGSLLVLLRRYRPQSAVNCSTL